MVSYHPQKFLGLLAPTQYVRVTRLSPSFCARVWLCETNHPLFLFSCVFFLLAMPLESHASMYFSFCNLIGGTLAEPLKVNVLNPLMLSYQALSSCMRKE